MATSRTMFEKIWQRHAIVQRGDDDVLLHVDTSFVAEGSFHAFGSLAKEGRRVRKPRQTFGSPDHYVPTVDRDRGVIGIADGEARGLVEYLAANAREHGFDHFGIDDARQGILHVIGPELGISQPGSVITCGDSHTATHGAVGAFAFGIGASQLKQVLATQCIWAEAAEDDAHQRARPARPLCRRQGRDPRGHCQDRHRRRLGACDRVRRHGDRGDEHGAAHDCLQHVDRSRGARRHDRARRHDLRVPSPAGLTRLPAASGTQRSPIGAPCPAMPMRGSTARCRSTRRSWRR